MKKYIYLPAVLLTAIGFASCSQEDIMPIGTDGETTIRVELPADLVTRYGSGTQATNLYVAVYESNSATPLLTNVNGAAEGLTVNNFNGSLTTTVQVNLVKNKSYDIIFWAESGDAATGSYVFDPDTKTVTVDYENMKNFEESRDAFYAHLNGFVATGESKDVILKRPFAQINIGTDDLAAYLKAAGTAMTSQDFGMTVSGVSNVLNLGDDTVTSTDSFDGNVTVGSFAIGTDTQLDAFPVTGRNLTYLDMGYFLVGDKGVAKTNLDISLTVGDNTSFATYSAVPAQMNYRTNIFGSLLTNKETFNVTIDPNFGNPDYNMPQDSWESVATTVPEPVNDVYTVSTPQELAAIAIAVNSGSDEFTGKTIQLGADIDLDGRLWTPIGTNGKPLKANFDGNGHTISNLYVNTPQSAGLIGYCWRKISNLTIDGAEIASHHWAGVVMGYCTDHANQGFERITVKNARVTVTPELNGTSYDNGDKAGAIVGYIAAQNTAAITNCTVDNVTIRAYRDAGGIGGLVDIPVTGCTVTNTTVILDGTNAYEGLYTTMGPIVGRGNTDVNSNSSNRYSGIKLEYTNWDDVTFGTLTPLADNTLTISNSSVSSLQFNTAAGSTINVTGNILTAPDTTPTGTTRFGVYVNAAAADYTLNIADNNFKSSWSHGVYVQGNNRTATAINVSGCSFAKWGMKEKADDTEAFSGCVKLYDIPNYAPTDATSFATLPAAGQAFVRAFFNSGNTWTLPAGVAYTVLNMNNICFTSAPR